MLSDSVIFRLIQISENSKRLSSSLRETAIGIDWYDIFGLRNRLVHDYGNVDYSIVYMTAKKDLPNLLGNIRTVLKDIVG